MAGSAATVRTAGCKSALGRCRPRAWWCNGRLRGARERSSPRCPGTAEICLHLEFKNKRKLSKEAPERTLRLHSTVAAPSFWSSLDDEDKRTAGTRDVFWLENPSSPLRDKLDNDDCCCCVLEYLHERFLYSTARRDSIRVLYFYGRNKAWISSGLEKLLHCDECKRVRRGLKQNQPLVGTSLQLIMKKRAVVVPAQERQKVQVVSCPCCEARLALHFVHGENEVYDVELVATAASTPHATVGNQSRLEFAAGNEGAEDAAFMRHKTQHDELHDNAAVGAATESLGASSSTRGSNSETHAAATSVNNQPAMREQLVRKDLHLPSSGSSKLFPLFYRPKKTVHLVRHGHTASQIGLEDASNRFDLRLTSLGHQQARSIAPKLALLKPEVIFVSPLTRALQTLCGAFPSVQEPGQPRVEVTPLHAEHVMSSGDVGRPPQILAGEYPWLSLDALPEVWWYSQSEFPNDAMRMEFNSVEPMEELRKRVGVFRQFLRSRPENVIVVIGHSTFFKELTSTRQRMMNCEIRTLML